MDFINGIAEYQFLRNALFAAILSGIACGVVGTYVVMRRLVSLSGGITHASFGGIGIAYYMGWNPVIGALAFAMLSSFGIELAGNKGKIREDSAIGIVWSLGMAIGIIFIYLTPGYAPNLMSFLFGNILTVTTLDVWLLLLFCVILVILSLLFIRTIMFVAFDRDFAKSRGVPVNAVSYVMSAFIALAIVFSIRVVGIMLLISLLTIPAVLVNSITKSYLKITVWAVVSAVVANIAGLWISYELNIPAGAATIFVLAFALIIVKLLPLCSKISYKKRGPDVSEDHR